MDRGRLRSRCLRLPGVANKNGPISTVNAHRIETLRLIIKFSFRGRSLGAGEILTGLGGFLCSLRELFCIQSSHSLGLLPMYKRPPHPSRNCLRFFLPRAVDTSLDVSTFLNGRPRLKHRAQRTGVHPGPITIGNRPCPLANFRRVLLPMEDQSKGARPDVWHVRSTAALSLLLLSMSFALDIPGRETIAAQSPLGSGATRPNSAASVSSSGAVILSKTFTLSGSKVWTDTGITLEPGQRLVVTADGKLPLFRCQDR